MSVAASFRNAAGLAIGQPSKRLTNISLALLVCLVALLIAQPALACSVCYGDPDSDMTKGAKAGVLVLLGVVGMVLLWVGSLLLFWRRRAANLDL